MKPLSNYVAAAGAVLGMLATSAAFCAREYYDKGQQAPGGVEARAFSNTWKETPQGKCYDGTSVEVDVVAALNGVEGSPRGSPRLSIDQVFFALKDLGYNPHDSHASPRDIGLFRVVHKSRVNESGLATLTYTLINPDQDVPSVFLEIIKSFIQPNGNYEIDGYWPLVESVPPTCTFMEKKGGWLGIFRNWAGLDKKGK